jgi:hypothetical protein
MFKPKSGCQKLKGMLSPYIDHQLTSSEQGVVEAHLERCEACQRELESLRAVVNLVHRVPMVSPPRSFTIAEAVPKRRAAPVAVFSAATSGAVLLLERRVASLAVLSAATAGAVLLLAFFFVSDALNLFASEVPVGVEERLGEVGLLAEPSPDMTGGAPDLAEAGYETVENWPFWQLEVAFSVLVVILGAMTLIWWLKRRKIKITERG